MLFELTVEGLDNCWLSISGIETELDTASGTRKPIDASNDTPYNVPDDIPLQLPSDLPDLADVLSRWFDH